MQKFRIFIILWFALVSMPSYGQWIEAYYQCICQEGSQVECFRQIDREFPDARDDIEREGPEAANSSLYLTQVRTAQLLLDQRNQLNAKESLCLDSPRMALKNALGFSIKEKMSGRPDSYIYIKALYDLSQQAYQWAEAHCFSKSNTHGAPFGRILPNSSSCSSP